MATVPGAPDELDEMLAELKILGDDLERKMAILANRDPRTGRPRLAVIVADGDDELDCSIEAISAATAELRAARLGQRHLKIV